MAEVVADVATATGHIAVDHGSIDRRCRDERSTRRRRRHGRSGGGEVRRRDRRGTTGIERSGVVAFAQEPAVLRRRRLLHRDSDTTVRGRSQNGCGEVAVVGHQARDARVHLCGELDHQVLVSVIVRRLCARNQVVGEIPAGSEDGPGVILEVLERIRRCVVHASTARVLFRGRTVVATDNLDGIRDGTGLRHLHALATDDKNVSILHARDGREVDGVGEGIRNRGGKGRAGPDQQ